MRVAGVDEAGRGCVIGPLVTCALALEEKDIPILQEWGVKDSKLLPPEKREEIYKLLVKRFDYHLAVVYPLEIDKAVSGPTSDNLNWLEGRKMAECMNVLKPEKSFIDCPSTNIAAFTGFLANLVSCKLVLEHKADTNYPVVGAASIIAKVTRDAEIEKIKARIGIDFGSGYSSDPKTQAFIKEYWNVYPDIFRRSWDTYSSIKKAAAQKGLGSFVK